MRISLGDTHWTLDEIGDVEWFMLIQLPEAADFTRSEKGRRRILPDPTDDEEEIVADWREFVVPELETGFTQAVDTVSHDLDTAEEIEGDDGKSWRRIVAPIDHGEIWYQVLNQARLIMNEEHELSKVERDLMMGEQTPTEIGEKNWLTLVQYRVYAAIQEFILTNIMGVDG